MNNGKLRVGELVSIDPWDCEGIENPWGLDAQYPPARRHKVKIKPGSLGMIVSRSDDPDYPSCKVLVNERYLDVHFHFLNNVKT
jgi:hypothetical protein